MNFVIGQRWISHTESQLGLGLIKDISDRLITISFPAVAEERTYAISSAPLSRVIYKKGDSVSTMDKVTITIDEAMDRSGLVFYSGKDEHNEPHTFIELELDCFVKFNSPDQRLLTNLFDSNALYQFRIDTLQHANRLQQSPAKGLLGSRTSLLPHQIYIASEIAKRFAPRVLLADEVGLGKTIEAGMILHQQLQTGLAKRVLILVPDTLIHQWLVEMLRKFNLRFSIFDQDRYDSLLEESPEQNPFDSEQLIISSLDFISNNQDALDSSLECDWDLLIVDEAHHLQWSDSNVDLISPEYQAVEWLAEVSAGVLLLTATPEQMGIESHFARLRLLDPARFYDLSEFIKEEAGYEKIAAIVQQLKETVNTGKSLSDSQLAQLEPYLGDELAAIKDNRHEANNETLVHSIIEKLLDRHGTGRVLFRNTRAAIDTFPERQLNAVELDRPIHYKYQDLYPELAATNDDWPQQDPRVDWLVEHLKTIKPAKALVICANASTAKTLEHHLLMKAGIRSAAFYESMSIIERDSAAAYFADDEDGAQVLVCSEIGSEGRNFQFAHHLVLFDLPTNPDLLEQRIGRLDRIGQLHPIQIHVPYFQDSAQEALFKWLNKGLNQFSRSCSIGNSIYQNFEKELTPLLLEPNPKALKELTKATHEYTEQAIKSMEQGRDPLLEFNSCNPKIAEELIEHIEQESDPELINKYSNRMFDLFGLDREEHSENAIIIHESEHMMLDSFPGLGSGAGTSEEFESLTLTSNREFALTREDMAYLTWEHPIIHDIMDMILSGELGNACIVTLPLKSIPPGTFMLEAFHSIKCMAPNHLQLDKYLPLTPTRSMVNLQGKNLANALSFEQLNQRAVKMKKSIAQGVLPQIQIQIEQLAQTAHQFADEQLKSVIDGSIANHKAAVSQEIERLKSLQKHNPTIRDEEIEYLEDHIAAGEHFMSKAQVQCEGLRMIITT